MALRLSDGLRNKLLGMSSNVGANGTFDTDTTSWTATDSTLASIAGGQSNNCLEVAESGGVNAGKAYQDITTVIGRIYKLSVYFKKGTADAGRFMIGTTGDEDAIYDSGALSDANWTIKTTLFEATATTTRVTLQTNDVTAGETSLFDEFTLDEIVDGFKEIMRGCKVAIYTGSQPADANSVATGTLLATISLSGGATGLSYANAASGAIAKNAAENWTGTAGATGTAGWFRCYQDGDVPANASTVFARFDGAIGTSGAELNMSNTSITSGAVQTVSSFTYTQPAS